MAINLKQISISDSDNIKLDKVNYNFDQLVANGGGPQGPQGPKGDMGFQGVMGPQGHQGAMGFQGDVGAPGPVTESYWTRVDGDNASLTTDTLFPEPNVGAQNPPVISIGFLSTDPEYGTHQNLSAGQSPYQWIINRKNHFFSNLRFKSSDVVDNWVDFILNYDQIAGKTTFRTQFKELGSAMPTRFIWSADNHIFRSNVTGQDILSINTNDAQFSEEVHFDSKVTINTELYIENANADLDKIATAVDNTGLVTFKTIAELGGTVPYGTIISVLPDVFTDNTRFVNSQTINLNQLPNTINDALKIRIGAGIGDYAGWYMCNGKVWIGDINQSQHLVPDLNSFTYSIAENPMSIDPNSQGTAGQTNPDINIIGGADIVMTAVTPAAGIYGIGSTVDTNDVDINTTAGTTFKIKKLPQIIYLGETDLYWKDKGTGQAPATTLNFQLVDANTGPNSLGTVSLGSAVYTQGGSYFHQVYVTAPVGYYWSTSPATLTFPGYIDGIVQTLSPGTYPTTIALNISVDSQPANGTTATIGIDTTSLVTLLPTFQTVLSRVSPIPNTSILPLNNGTITYNTNTGYTFDIIITADTNYRFTSPTAVTFTGATTPSAATFTINSSTYTGIANGYPNNDQQITLNVTLTGVPYGTATVYYGLQGGPVINVPILTAGASKYIGPLMFASGTLSNDTSGTVTVVNNTGSTKYLYLTINNFTTGGTSGNDTVSASWSTLSAAALPPQNTVSSSNYVTIANGATISDLMDIYAGSDNYYEVYLQWSSTPGGTKYHVTYP